MRLKRSKNLVDDDDISEDDDLDLDLEPDVDDSKDLGLGDDDLFKEDLGLDDFGLGSSLSSPMEKYSDLLKSLTNFDIYLKNTVNGWLGLTWNEKEGKHIPDKAVTPLMNVRCAAWCVSFLKTYARGNNIITNINEREYSFLVEDIIDTVWLNIGTRAEEFDIMNNGDILRICTEIEHAAQLVLMGAGDGKYNQFLSTVTQRNESISGQPGTNVNVGGFPIPRSARPNALKRLKNWALGEGGRGGGL